ncbi:MAG: restriction endonuclease subunit S [Nitrosomonas sp.]|uniref:restriction endonuclease subunit S n=1 Tax=Nitrosomonas sp. TaxID=42353 RepID=UPI0032F04456
MSWSETEFENLYETPSKNGLTRPARVRGSGYKMINMGELFANDRISTIDMELVLMDDKEISQMLVEKNDLLFARQSLVLAGAGKCSIVKDVDQPTTFESHIIRVRLNKKISNPKFYYYYFKSPVCRIKSIVTQGVQAGIRGNDLKRLIVHTPPLEVQNRISEVLEKYDDLIENNKRRIELLEESARQLYKEWFVRFRFPGHEHVKIVGGMPEGWESCPASDALHINPRVSVEKGKEIVCVPMASLSESQMTVDKSAFEQRTNHTSVKFMRGDTLFARITPCLENGKTAFVYFLEEGEIACGSTEFVVLRGKKVSKQFTYLLAREESFRGNAIKSMIGSSGRQRVQPSCFDKYIVPIAPNYIQEQFDSMVSSAFEQIAVLAKQNEQLARARDLLLPKLMSGEIAV